MRPGELFDKVVAESTLGLVAPFAIARALRRVGVIHPERELSRAQLHTALPHIREVLALYLEPAAAEAAAQRIGALVRD
jgi:hypothetical protein